MEGLPPLHVFIEHIASRLHVKDVHNFRLASRATKVYTDPWAQARREYIAQYYKRDLPQIAQSVWVLCRHVTACGRVHTARVRDDDDDEDEDEDDEQADDSDGFGGEDDEDDDEEDDEDEDEDEDEDGPSATVEPWQRGPLVMGVAVDVSLPLPAAQDGSDDGKMEEVCLWVDVSGVHTHVLRLDDLYLEMNSELAYELSDRISPHLRISAMRQAHAALANMRQFTPVWQPAHRLTWAKEACASREEDPLNAHIRRAALEALSIALERVTATCAGPAPKCVPQDPCLSHAMTRAFRARIAHVAMSTRADAISSWRSALWQANVAASADLTVAAYLTSTGYHANAAAMLRNATLAGFVVLVRVKTSCYDCYASVTDRGGVSVDSGAEIRQDLDDGTVMPLIGLPIALTQLFASWALDKLERISVAHLYTWDGRSSATQGGITHCELEAVVARATAALVNFLATSAAMMLAHGDLPPPHPEMARLM
jgi:hypothetical protein